MEPNVQIASLEKPEQRSGHPPTRVRERRGHATRKPHRHWTAMRTRRAKILGWFGSHLSPEVDCRGDEEAVDEVDTERTDQRHDEVRLRRRTVALDERAHVGHGICCRTKHEPAKTTGHDDSVVVPAHETRNCPDADRGYKGHLHEQDHQQRNDNSAELPEPE